MSYVTTNVRLDPDVYRDLQTQALADGISVAEAIRRALRTHAARWRGEAREEAAEYQAATSQGGGPAGVAVGSVRDGTLVVPAPDGLPIDIPILVAILGPVTEADLRAIRRQDQAREALRRELAGLTNEPPVGLNEDDREIYRP